MVGAVRVAAEPVDAVLIDVVVVGGGQAGLAAGYHLRRAGLEPARQFVILDADERPGGSWQHMWPSLRLFSPAAYSSLPGWLMPRHFEDYPPAGHVVEYLAQYEQRYDLPVVHGTRVVSVSEAGPQLTPASTRSPWDLGTLEGAPEASERLASDTGRVGRLEVRAADGRRWLARALVSATGTWGRPFIPRYPGQPDFAGRQLHSADYVGPDAFVGRRVLVVGGGNTAAQLLAELSEVAETTWVTLRPPRFLPDTVDGRVLFDVATARRRAMDNGADPGGVSQLGDIVMVSSVRNARSRGALRALPMFTRLTPSGARWADGTTQGFDVVLWCTGYRPNLGYLAPLALARRNGHPDTYGTRAVSDPRVHLVGYGDWTGPASATLIGVGRTAKEMATHVTAQLRPAQC